MHPAIHPGGPYRQQPRSREPSVLLRARARSASILRKAGGTRSLKRRPQGPKAGRPSAPTTACLGGRMPHAPWHRRPSTPPTVRRVSARASRSRDCASLGQPHFVTRAAKHPPHCAGPSAPKIGTVRLSARPDSPPCRPLHSIPLTLRWSPVRLAPTRSFHSAPTDRQAAETG